MRHPGGVRGSRSSLVVLWVALAVAVVVSGWVGVHMVGQTLAPNAAPVLSHQEMEALLATADPKVTPAPTGPGHGSGANDGANDGDTDGDDHGGGATSEPSRSPDNGGTASPGSGGSPNATKSPGPGAQTVYRTFRSRGGSAVMSCTGSRITLRSWSPAVGYRIAEKQEQFSEVEVKFEGASGESTIHATCVSGTPVADIDSESESESGDD